MSVSVVVGNPKPRSRTYQAANLVAAAVFVVFGSVSWVDAVPLAIGLLEHRRDKVADSGDGEHAARTEADIEAYVEANRGEPPASARNWHMAS